MFFPLPFIYFNSNFVIDVRLLCQVIKCEKSFPPFLFFQFERYADVALVQLAQIVIRSGTSYADYLSDAATLLNTAMHVDPNEVYSSFFVIFELKIPTVFKPYVCL